MRPDCIKKGPFRPFIINDAYQALPSTKIGPLDFIMAALLGISLLLKGIRVWQQESYITPSEEDLVDAISEYMKKEFFLMSSPPFMVQILALVSRILGSLSIEVLRKINLTTTAFVVSSFYLALRRSGVVFVVSAVTAGSLSYLPLFAENSQHLSLINFQVLFLSCCLLSWNSFKHSTSFTRRWYVALTSLSLFLSLSLSTTFLGAITWSWFLILMIKQMWSIVGDVDVSMSKILKHTFWRVLMIICVPFGLMLSSYFVFLLNSRGAGMNHSSLVSPYFKTWFLPQGLPQPDAVYYGSNLLIRHAESLGGYLHSHNYTYESGSLEQQVTLVDFSNDADNEWIIEAQNENMKLDKTLQPVRNGDFVKLRHRTSGKLLRASSAKAPVSEQDYDHEVSCTGDHDYTGDSDETWRIRFERGNTPNEGILCPFTMYFSLENKGHNCKLLSHDLRLPDWGFGQQEVLCVDSASPSRSLFFVDRSNLYKERGAYLTYPKQWKLKRLWNLAKEYIQRQHKYDYYIKNRDAVNAVGVSDWFKVSPSTTGIKLIWYTPLCCLIIYALVQLKSWATWNPWATKIMLLAPETFLYLDNSLELSLGWFLHYYIFTWSKHENLKQEQYLPSYLLSLLLAGHTANFLWIHSNYSRTALALLVAGALALTFKFS